MDESVFDRGGRGPAVSDSRIAEAVRAFRAGDLDQVESLCAGILAAEPRATAAQAAEAQHLTGLVRFRRGDHFGAEASLRRALDIAPAHPECRNNLGMILRQQGRMAEAVVQFEEAVRLAPAYVDALGNLGDACRQLGRFEAGEAALTTALGLRPDALPVLNNLALLRRAQGRHGEAVELLQRARAVAPGNWETACNLAYSLRDQGDFAAARELFAELLSHAPPGAGTGPLRHALGEVCRTLGHYDEALTHFEAILAEQPGNPSIRFIVQGLRKAPVDTAPASFVRELFDSCAENFDRILVDRLAYRIPQRLAAMLVASAPEAIDVLDLGCGTGLVGDALRGHLRSLVGVDLSPKMLAQAEKRGVYTRLVGADLLAALRDEPDAGFDAVAAGDVFIYVGKLDAVCAETWRVLRPGGRFAFSVETTGAESADEGYQLHEAGRFAHGRAYLDRLARQCGFSTEALEEVVLRQENHRAVPGLNVLWRKAGPGPATAVRTDPGSS